MITAMVLPAIVRSMKRRSTRDATLRSRRPQTSDLSLVDLRDDHALRMGVPTDVAKSSLQSLARSWALAFHEHPSLPEGIIYPCRLNGHTNIAVFGRAVVPKLAPAHVVPLTGAPGLAAFINDLRLRLVAFP